MNQQQTTNLTHNQEIPINKIKILGTQKYDQQANLQKKSKSTIQSLSLDSHPKRDLYTNCLIIIATILSVIIITIIVCIQYYRHKETRQNSSQKINMKNNMEGNLQRLHSNIINHTFLGNQGQRPITSGISNDQRKFSTKLIKIKDLDFDIQTNLTLSQKNYYEEKYNISTYEQLPFCIVVPSYNNVKNDRYLNNIRSIVMQDYSNYHIVFIDDASTDETGLKVKEFMQNQTKISIERYTVVINERNMKAMLNIRRAAQEFCEPEDIFMVIDGDDEMLGRQVLKLFNAVFQKQNAWFVYSNFLFPNSKVGYSRPFTEHVIKANSYRNNNFVTSHLRAFYTKLLVNIKDDDLKDKNGSYFKAANDVAICIPILQQSHLRVFYLRELTYLYNSNTGLNNHKLRLKQQQANNKYIRTKKTYKQLRDLNQSAIYLRENMQYNKNNSQGNRTH